MSDVSSLTGSGVGVTEYVFRVAGTEKQRARVLKREKLAPPTEQQRGDYSCKDDLLWQLFELCQLHYRFPQFSCVKKSVFANQLLVHTNTHFLHFTGPDTGFVAALSHSLSIDCQWPFTMCITVDGSDACNYRRSLYSVSWPRYVRVTNIRK